LKFFVINLNWLLQIWTEPRTEHSKPAVALQDGREMTMNKWGSRYLPLCIFTLHSSPLLTFLSGQNLSRGYITSDVTTYTKKGPRTILLSDLKGQGTFGMKDTEGELEKKKNSGVRTM